MISRRTMLGSVVAATGAALAKGADVDEKKPVAETPLTYTFRLQQAKPHEYDGGSIREHRVSNFPISANMAGAAVRLAVGAFREPHWHPNSDEWAYILAGKVRLTVVAPHGHTAVEDLDYGDVWFVPVGFGHSVMNIGDS